MERARINCSPNKKDKNIGEHFNAYLISLSSNFIPIFFMLIIGSVRLTTYYTCLVSNQIIFRLGKWKFDNDHFTFDTK